MTDPPILSLDIETYGASRHNNNWMRLPSQKYFHPRKSEYWQCVDRNDLVITCAVTLMEKDTRDSSGQWTKQAISELVPGETIFFDMSKGIDNEVLCNWIKYADTIIGSNIQFDISYLRRFRNEYKFLLDGRHTYIDTTIAAYLWNELSSSRSLKKLGPLLGQFSYDESLASDHRFNHPNDHRLKRYNCQDTHNTVLVLAELAKRMPTNTHKFTPFCINHYSQAINSVITMSDSGIPFSSLRLEKMREEMDAQIKSSREQAKDIDLRLGGKGSHISKTKFFDEAITEIQEAGNEDILDLLDKTEKNKQVSHSKRNRIILMQYLPQHSRLYQGLELFGKFQDAQKLLSTYLYPLLLHKRNDPTNLNASLIPLMIKGQEKYTRFFKATELTGEVDELQSKSSPFAETLNRCSDRTPQSLTNRFIDSRVEEVADCNAFPSWFITPSKVKNDSGSQGGTIQGRITCKDPHAQTFPSSIKECICSRFKDGKIIGLDLSQIELRVAALLSGEQSMIRSYQDKRDLHADRARTLWPNYDTEPDTQKQRRQVGKMMNFADLFLASANTMREQVYAQSGGDINLPLDIYQQVVRTRPEVRPQLNKWQKQLLIEAKVNGVIELPFIGQSRQFSNIAAERSEIVNFPVQTTASNLMMQIQGAMTRNLKAKSKKRKEPLIFLQVFDAVYVDTPPQCDDIVVSSFQEAMDSVMQPSGYWGMLCKYHNQELLPLEFDVETSN